MPNWCNSIIKMEGEKDTLKYVFPVIHREESKTDVQQVAFRVEGNKQHVIWQQITILLT